MNFVVESSVLVVRDPARSLDTGSATRVQRKSIVTPNPRDHVELLVRESLVCFFLNFHLHSKDIVAMLCILMVYAYRGSACSLLYLAPATLNANVSTLIVLRRYVRLSHCNSYSFLRGSHRHRHLLFQPLSPPPSARLAPTLEINRRRSTILPVHA